MQLPQMKKQGGTQAEVCAQEELEPAVEEQSPQQVQAPELQAQMGQMPQKEAAKFPAQALEWALVPQL